MAGFMSYGTGKYNGRTTTGVAYVLGYIHITDNMMKNSQRVSITQ